MALYKNRMPKSEDETEYIGNLFNALCSTLMTERNRHAPSLLRSSKPLLFVKCLSWLEGSSRVPWAADTARDAVVVRGVMTMKGACRQLFCEAEGVELMALILKQRRRVRFGALKAVVSSVLLF